jgi:hypothetical protein
MAKDQQSRTFDGHGTIENGANAGIADILAYAVESLSGGDKIDVKTGCDAARPVFEFSDIVRA